LTGSNIVSITQTNPDSTTKALAPATDGDINFAVSNPAGKYTFTAIDTQGNEYQGSYTWAGAAASTAAYNTTVSTSDGFNLTDASGNALAPAYLYVVDPSGTASASTASGSPVTIGTGTGTLANDAVFSQSDASGTYTLYFTDRSGNWYTTTVDYPAEAQLAPTLKSAAISDPTTTTSSLVLTYNGNLTSNSPTASQFAVSVNGKSATVSGASASGTTVTLTVGQLITSSDTVTVSYTPSTSGTNILGVNSTPVASISSQAVTNNVTPASVTSVTYGTYTSGGQSSPAVTLTYNGVLNSNSQTNPPAASSYQVNVNGASDSVTGVIVTPGTTNGTVTLTLVSPIPSGQTATLTYTAPTSNALTDVNGSQAANITNQLISN
jgi:uncharacterized repeat protein (TIGR02059 family)